MQNLSDITVLENTSIISAMSKINANTKGIVFVCNEDGRLLATLTDGDIRRHIIAGRSLEAPVSEAAKYQFHYVMDELEYHKAQEICKKLNIDALPRIDKDMHLVSIFYKNDDSDIAVIRRQINAPVVVMAGGKGTRLYPYTKILPKPLIPIGEITIIEHIFKSFLNYGCNSFTMIVNHKKNMIKAYLADEALNYNVSFVDEVKPLGTGGGLSLLRGAINETFFMTNCDILIFEDYSKILDYHKNNENLLTVVCSTKNIEIPYGVINVKEHGQILRIEEKPNFSFLTNTGFYIIEPSFLEKIPADTHIHITDIIQHCIDEKEKIGVFPIDDNQWSDMGQLEEMEKMQERLKQ